MHFESIQPSPPPIVKIEHNRHGLESKIPSQATLVFRRGFPLSAHNAGIAVQGLGTGFVWVNDEEIAQIAKAIGMENDLEEFERKFTRRVGTESVWSNTRMEIVFFCIRHLGLYGLPCRPSQCRTWPFWASNIKSPRLGSKQLLIVQVATRNALLNRADCRTDRPRDVA